MEINPPAVRHTSVCSPPRLTLQLFLSDGSVYANASCSSQSEVSEDLRYMNTSLRLSLEDTVDTSKPDGPRGEFAHLFVGGTKKPAKLFLDEEKHSKTTICGTYSIALVSQ